MYFFLNVSVESFYSHFSSEVGREELFIFLVLVIFGSIFLVVLDWFSDLSEVFPDVELIFCELNFLRNCDCEIVFLSLFSVFSKCLFILTAECLVFFIYFFNGFESTECDFELFDEKEGVFS